MSEHHWPAYAILFFVLFFSAWGIATFGGFVSPTFLADPATTTSWGAIAGFLAGFGWIFMGLGVVAMFEGRSWSYIFINGGYMTVALVLMGAILGAWR